MASMTASPTIDDLDGDGLPSIGYRSLNRGAWVYDGDVRLAPYHTTSASVAVCCTS